MGVSKNLSLALVVLGLAACSSSGGGGGGGGNNPTNKAEETIVSSQGDQISSGLTDKMNNAQIYNSEAINTTQNSKEQASHVLPTLDLMLSTEAQAQQSPDYQKLNHAGQTWLSRIFQDCQVQQSNPQDSSLKTWTVTQSISGDRCPISLSSTEDHNRNVDESEKAKTKHGKETTTLSSTETILDGSLKSGSGMSKVTTTGASTQNIDYTYGEGGAIVSGYTHTAQSTTTVFESAVGTVTLNLYVEQVDRSDTEDTAAYLVFDTPKGKFTASARITSPKQGQTKAEFKIGGKTVTADEFRALAL